jgi:hypothetical protein
MKSAVCVTALILATACTRDASDDSAAGLPPRYTGSVPWSIAGVAPGDARSAIEEKLACIFHGNAFDEVRRGFRGARLRARRTGNRCSGFPGSMGVRFFVRPTKAYRDMPRE